MFIALTRAVPSSINNGERTHVDRVPIDVDRAREQHRAYEEALGCRIERVPPADDLPDSVFVEDIAVVVEEIAVITRPGAESRRAEIDGVAATLKRFRDLRFIEAPGTLDGGDVLRIGERIYVGLSQRTNAQGAQQLRDHVEPFGYELFTVPVHGALHLKSAVTQIRDDAVLINPQWVEGFDDYQRIAVHPDEPFAANALRVGDSLIYSMSFPRTLEKLAGLDVRLVDASEIAKAEGGVTCCSIVLSV